MYGLLQNLVVLRRLHAQWLRGRAYQPHFAWPDALAAWLGGLVAITALGLISNWSHYPLVVAPLGASTVLLFGHPASPLSQPRNIVAGNTLGALISVLCVAEWGLAVWVMGLAVGLTIALGQLLRCLHPPAGAVALLGVLLAAKPGFVVVPILMGSLLLVGMATLFSRLRRSAEPYPHHWL
ncbi:MAG: HPP family protein [Synechococcaceae cyanobacterium]